jgi:hypothetical protein
VSVAKKHVAIALLGCAFIGAAYLIFGNDPQPGGSVKPPSAGHSWIDALRQAESTASSVQAQTTDDPLSKARFDTKPQLNASTQLVWTKVQADEGMLAWIQSAYAGTSTSAALAADRLVMSCAATKDLIAVFAGKPMSELIPAFEAQWGKARTTEAAIQQWIREADAVNRACTGIDLSLVNRKTSADVRNDKSDLSLQYLLSRNGQTGYDRKQVLIQALANPALNSFVVATWLETDFWSRDIGKTALFSPKQRAAADQLLFESLTQASGDYARKQFQCVSLMICSPSSALTNEEMLRVSGFVAHVDNLIRTQRWDMLF